MSVSWTTNMKRRTIPKQTVANGRWSREGKNMYSDK